MGGWGGWRRWVVVVVRLVMDQALCTALGIYLDAGHKGWFETIIMPRVSVVLLYTIVQYFNTFAILTIYCTVLGIRQVT